MAHQDADRERRPRATAVWTAIIALAALLLAVPAARAQDPASATDRYPEFGHLEVGGEVLGDRHR